MQRPCPPSFFAFRTRASPRPGASGIPRRHLRVALEKPAEIRRVLEPQLVADFVHRAGGEQQQALGLLHQALVHQAFRRQVGDAPADIVEARLGDADLPGIARQRPMLQVLGFDQFVEAMEDLQVFVPRRARLEGIGREPEQADQDQAGQGLERRRMPGALPGDFLLQLIEQQRQAPRLAGEPRVQACQGHAGRRHLGAAGQTAVGFDQLPHQLLAHGQHVAFAVGLGDEGMGNGWWREEKHRPRFQVLLVVEVNPHRAAFHIVHLEKPVVTVHRHVAAEEPGQVAQLVVMHLRVGVTLVVDLADVDVGDRLAIAHGGVSLFSLAALSISPQRFFIFTRGKRPHPA